MAIPARFAAFGLPVVADVVEGFAGPLAGVLTGMEWTRAQRPDCPWIATIATDTPFFPSDLVARLLDAVERGGAELACASSGGRAHPVFGLWPVRLADELRAAMVEEGIRKVDVWTARHRLVEVPFATDPIDPFFNTNRPEDLAEAERLLREVRALSRARGVQAALGAASDGSGFHALLDLAKGLPERGRDQIRAGRLEQILAFLRAAAPAVQRPTMIRSPLPRCWRSRLTTRCACWVAAGLT